MIDDRYILQVKKFSFDELNWLLEDMKNTDCEAFYDKQKTVGYIGFVFGRQFTILELQVALQKKGSDNDMFDKMVGHILLPQNHPITAKDFPIEITRWILLSVIDRAKLACKDEISLEEYKDTFNADKYDLGTELDEDKIRNLFSQYAQVREILRKQILEKSVKKVLL